MAHKINREQDYLDALCALALAEGERLEAAVQLVNALSAPERDEFLLLADSHHVIIRALRAAVAHPAASACDQGMGGAGDPP